VVHLLVSLLFPKAPEHLAQTMIGQILIFTCVKKSPETHRTTFKRDVHLCRIDHAQHRAVWAPWAIDVCVAVVLLTLLEGAYVQYRGKLFLIFVFKQIKPQTLAVRATVHFTDRRGDRFKLGFALRALHAYSFAV
jgi:hypothetical protein